MSGNVGKSAGQLETMKKLWFIQRGLVKGESGKGVLLWMFY